MRALVLAAAITLAGCASLPARTAQPVAQAGIAFDRQGELAVFADGLADPAAGRAMTPDDPARVASVSKVVVAIGVMRLVDAGKLDLDADVSTYLGWRLRNPAYPDTPITLGQLLSHTSSIRDHDDQYAVPLGATVRAAMAEATSWDPSHGPSAAYFTYSNMNFPIVAQVIERVTGERFDRWIRANVLDPMRIDACFNWPTCSDAAIARAVVLTRDGKVIRDDLHGARPECPVYARDGEPCDLARSPVGENGALFSPQGGLRISVRGLARVGRMLLGGGTLDGVQILSPGAVDALLAQRWLFDGGNGATDAFYCAYGYASQALVDGNRGCAPLPPLHDYRLVGHAGEAYGLRSGLWIDRARGVGIAYLLTGQPDAAPGNAAMTPAEAATFSRGLALLPR